jgi:dihydroorotate dehydrogenase (fumarate)
MIRTDVTLADMKLQHPIMNAAGTCKSIEDVKKFARSAVAAIVIGSITSESRDGNPGQTYYKGQGWSLNSLGMPNRGLRYYMQWLPEMVAVAHEAGKPLIVSVAGFNLREYVHLASTVMDLGADHVELNLGCPNIWDNGCQKRIASFDLEYMELLLGELYDRLGRVATKLSPYSDPWMLAQAASILSRWRVSYAAVCNTFANALQLHHNGKSVIDVGLAGMSGEAMKPIGLGQVSQFRDHLAAEVQLVGVGGIKHGIDAHEYRLVGADAVQIATAYWNRNEDPSVFGEILSQYVDYR